MDIKHPPRNHGGCRWGNHIVGTIWYQWGMGLLNDYCCWKSTNNHSSPKFDRFSIIIYNYMYTYNVHIYIYTYIFFPAICYLSSEELLCQLVPTFAKLNGAMENLQTKRELRVKRNPWLRKPPYMIYIWYDMIWYDLSTYIYIWHWTLP